MLDYMSQLPFVISPREFMVSFVCSMFVIVLVVRLVILAVSVRYRVCLMPWSLVYLRITLFLMFGFIFRLVGSCVSVFVNR